jgi:hypothetical protein
MARIVPTILLHFLHPWRSDVGGAENAMNKNLVVSSVHMNYNITHIHKDDTLIL